MIKAECQQSLKQIRQKVRRRMQIVIKIQEDDFEKIKKTSFVEDTETIFYQSPEDRKDTMMLFRILDAIKDCTPLPEESGIDNDYMTGYNCGYYDAVCDMSEN